MGLLIRLWDWLERLLSFPATRSAVISGATIVWGWLGHYPPLYVALGVLDAAIAGCFVVPAYSRLRESLAKSPIKISSGPQFADDESPIEGWPYRVTVFNSGMTTLKNVAVSYSWHSKSDGSGNAVSLENHFSPQFKNGTLNARTKEDVVFLTDSHIDAMEHYAEEDYEHFDVFVRVEAEDTLPAQLRLRFTAPKDRSNGPWTVSTP